MCSLAEARAMRMVSGCDLPPPRLRSPAVEIATSHATFSTCRSVGADLLRRLQSHHATCLTRVYPAATRVWSSNFDTFPLWGAGVQLAALNYQCAPHAVYTYAQ